MAVRPRRADPIAGLTPEPITMLPRRRRWWSWRWFLYGAVVAMVAHGMPRECRDDWRWYAAVAAWPVTVPVIVLLTDAGATRAEPLCRPTFDDRWGSSPAQP